MCVEGMGAEYGAFRPLEGPPNLGWASLSLHVARTLRVQAVFPARDFLSCLLTLLLRG